MSQPKVCEVVIDIKPNGTGTIHVDGVDWSNRVSRVDFTARAGKITDVVLTMSAAHVKAMSSAYVTTEPLVINEDDGEVTA